MTEQLQKKPGRTRTIAMTLVVLVSLCLLFAAYLVKTGVDTPAKFIDNTPGFIQELFDISADGMAKLAQAINTRTINKEYISTATRLAGTTRLQVATIRQVEIFERRDSSMIWGIQLPDVVVSARAPIEYTYYIDLTDALDFYLLDDRHLYAVVPGLKYNKPAIDISQIDYTVQKGSVVRNHDAAVQALRTTMTEQSLKRARDNLELAREMARREIAWFVQKFIGDSFDLAVDLPVTVVFRDEPLPEALDNIETRLDRSADGS